MGQNVNPLLLLFIFYGRPCSSTSETDIAEVGRTFTATVNLSSITLMSSVGFFIGLLAFVTPLVLLFQVLNDDNTIVDFRKDLEVFAKTFRKKLRFKKQRKKKQIKRKVTNIDRKFFVFFRACT